MRSRRTLALAASLSLLACDGRSILGDDVIIDDWGPPAGYAVLAGSVQRADGLPGARLEVAFSRCTLPIGGHLATTTTSDAGTFRVMGWLPPIGMIPPLSLDTLQVRCAVFTDRTGTERDTVRVRFARDSADAPVTVVNVLLLPTQ